MWRGVGGRGVGRGEGKDSVRWGGGADVGVQEASKLSSDASEM